VCSVSLIARQSVIYPLAGGKIVVDHYDRVSRSLFLRGRFESEVVAALKKYLSPGMTFFDVGANIGLFSIIASQLVGPLGKVHTFEPDPRNFRRLTRNIAISHFSNVILNQLALLDKNGTISLRSVAEDGLGMFSTVGEPLRGVPPTIRTSEKTLTQEVTCSTLEEYAIHHRVERIDLVKVDVEGAELSVLRGCEQLLKRKDAPVLIVEFNRVTSGVLGYDLVTLRRYVESLGYILYRITENGTLSKLGNVLGISRYENLVAVKPAHSQRKVRSA